MSAQGDFYIPTTGNIVLVEKYMKECVYRLLGESGEDIWLMKIGDVNDGVFRLGSPPKNLGNRKCFKRAALAELHRVGKWRHIDERGIPDGMKSPPDEATNEKLFLKKRDLVTYVDKTWGNAVVFSKEMYSEAISNSSEMFSISRRSARLWLEAHLFYGRHPNALLTHDWNKGGPGVSRRDLKDGNGKLLMMGRRTYRERIGSPSPGDAGSVQIETWALRRRLTGKMKERLRAFVKRMAWNTNLGATAIVQRFKETCVGRNRDKDGIVRAYPIDPKYLPRDENLIKVVTPMLRDERAKREDARTYDAGTKRRLSGGSAQQLADGDISVFDLDATPAKIFIRHGGIKVQIDGNSKPTVVLAVDRGSSAIVGWHVSLNPERGEAYLACLFSAYTPKEYDMQRYDVPDLQGLVSGQSSFVFVDRGPGASARVQNALGARLATGQKLAKPGDPQAKGHAEQVMDMVQHELSDLPGSTYLRGGNPNDLRNRRKNARKNASVCIEIFMQALLTAISKRNLTMDARHLLTKEMGACGIEPVPAHIFWFNQSRRRGDAAENWSQEELYRRLCEKKSGVPARSGTVTYKGNAFTSDDLQEYSRLYSESHRGKTCEIDIYLMPSAPHYLIWEMPGGGLGCLKATHASLSKLSNTFDWINNHERMRVTGNLMAQRHKHRKQPNVRNVIEENKLSLEKQGKLEKADRAAASRGLKKDGREARRQGADFADKCYGEDMLVRAGVRGGITNSSEQEDDLYLSFDDSQDFFSE